MLPRTYSKKLLRIECNPNLQSQYCFADLDEDIGGVLPYLPRTLVNATYSESPLHVLWETKERRIVFFPRRILINAIKDETEAEKTLQWLLKMIGEVSEKGSDIQQREGVICIPDGATILDLLPQSDCQECGQANCMSFSTLVAEGFKRPDDCPQMSREDKSRMYEYLSLFH